MKILTIKQSLALTATVLTMSATAALASDFSSTVYTVILKDGQECYLDHGNPIPLPGNGVESNRVTIFAADQHQWYIDRDGRKVSLAPTGGSVDLNTQPDRNLDTASNPVTYLTSHGEQIVVQQQQPVIIEE